MRRSRAEAAVRSLGHGNGAMDRFSQFLSLSLFSKSGGSFLFLNLPLSLETFTRFLSLSLSDSVIVTGNGDWVWL